MEIIGVLPFKPVACVCYENASAFGCYYMRISLASEILGVLPFKPSGLCFFYRNERFCALTAVISVSLRMSLTSLRCWSCCRIRGALLSISTLTSSRRSPAFLGETLVELCAELCMHWRHLNGECPNWWLGAGSDSSVPYSLSMCYYSSLGNVTGLDIVRYAFRHTMPIVFAANSI